MDGNHDDGEQRKPARHRRRVWLALGAAAVGATMLIAVPAIAQSGDSGLASGSNSRNEVTSQPAAAPAEVAVEAAPTTPAAPEPEVAAEPAAPAPRVEAAPEVAAEPVEVVVVCESGVVDQGNGVQTSSAYAYRTSDTSALPPGCRIA